MNDNEWRKQAYLQERTLMYLSAYGGYAFLALTGLFFFVIGGWFPPHDPTWSAAELGAFYNDNHTRIQIGVVGAFVSIGLYIPLYSMVSQIIEDHLKMPMLAKMQLNAAIMGGVFVWFMFLAWAIAMYRPERNPEITQAFNDWGWMIAWWTVNCTQFQVLAWGLAILLCKPENQVFDRWFGWLLVFAVLVEIVAWGIPLMKTGPFAYNGELAFWFMVPLYGIFVFFSAQQSVKALRTIDEKMKLPRWSW